MPLRRRHPPPQTLPIPTSVEPPFFFHYEASEFVAFGREGEETHLAGGFPKDPSPSSSSPFSTAPIVSGRVHSFSCRIRTALRQQRFPATFLMITNNTSRAGAACWRGNKLTLRGEGPSDSSSSEDRVGIAPWVLNFVFPRSRLAGEREEERRRAQEALLLRAIVFQVVGMETGKGWFAHENSLFYVLNSGVDLDEGRMYFVLHLHLPTGIRGVEKGKPSHASPLRGLDREEVLLLEEKEVAFLALENLREQWGMPDCCGGAVSLAAAFPDSGLK
ncbi:unnamed protein product [Phytomonas sp. EM1]|nr:unnamed protein product [Phytomonas sp. EM1]|eukprot:CCW61391.1 unnamed protein product [Phytomonas sp. isolate EM1]